MITVIGAIVFTSAIKMTWIQKDNNFKKHSFHFVNAHIPNALNLLLLIQIPITIVHARIIAIITEENMQTNNKTHLLTFANGVNVLKDVPILL